jgi:hypothetical protein
MASFEFIAAVWLKISFVWKMTLRLWVSVTDVSNEIGTFVFMGT